MNDAIELPDDAIELPEEIKELQARASELREQLFNADMALYYAGRAFVASLPPGTLIVPSQHEKCQPIPRGALVEYRNHRGRMDIYWEGGVSPMVRLLKKDGTFAMTRPCDYNLHLWREVAE